MISFFAKNLLAIGLLVGSTLAFAQSESFIIECKVSGEHSTIKTDSKITNQLIIVSVTSNPTDASVTIEGSGYLNIGTIKVRPLIFDKEQIVLSFKEKMDLMEIYSRVSINRTTGFIDIFQGKHTPSFNHDGITKASGFCSKSSNKQKF
jgi:hypothetical protein